VVDNLRAIRRRLDPTYLDDATVVTDEDLAVLANCRAVEDPSTFAVSGCREAAWSGSRGGDVAAGGCR